MIVDGRRIEIDHSPATMIAHRLLRTHGRAKAHEIVDAYLSKLSARERAALARRWEFWARTKQLAPSGDWRSWGFLTGRGLGKTQAITNHINTEVREGRAGLICLMAQDEQNSIDVQVLGPSGLVTMSPPWFRAAWEATAKQVVWPNGARAYVRTPEVPGKVRGLEYHLGWATEFQSWPTVTRDEAYTNLLLSVRLGYARLIWDATPKKKHPILLDRLAIAALDPLSHVVVRGTTYENILNLGPGYIQSLERKFGGTAKGDEEIKGLMLTDAENPTATQACIDANRRASPPLVRRAVSIDPAVSTNKGSDRTGIVYGGAGADRRLYVHGDLSGKYKPEEWSKIAIDTHESFDCDCIVVERNRGGDMVVSNIRAAALARNLRVEVVNDKWHPHRKGGTVFVREVHSRGAKEDRAQPLRTAYARNLVSHVGTFPSLEDTLTTWEAKPGENSPDDLDALVGLATECLDLATYMADHHEGFKGITELAAALRGDHSTSVGSFSIADLLGSSGGDKI